MKTETKKYIVNITLQLVCSIAVCLYGIWIGQGAEKDKRAGIIKYEKQQWIDSLEWWQRCGHTSSFWIHTCPDKLPPSLHPKQHMVKLTKGQLTVGYVDPVNPTNGVINMSTWKTCQVCSKEP